MCPRAISADRHQAARRDGRGQLDHGRPRVAQASLDTGSASTGHSGNSTRAGPRRQTIHPWPIGPPPLGAAGNRLIPEPRPFRSPPEPHEAARALGRLSGRHTATVQPSDGRHGLQADAHGPHKAGLQRARSRHPGGASRRSAARSLRTPMEASTRVKYGCSRRGRRPHLTPAGKKQQHMRTRGVSVANTRHR